MSQNPYESPRYDSIDDGSAGELVYYQPLSTKLSIAEYWRISKSSFEFMLAVGVKLLRIRLPLSFAFADASQFQRIATQQLSDQARESLKPVVDEALALGMRYGFAYHLPSVGTIEGAAAAMYSDDGRILLPVVYARTWTKAMVDEKVAYAFVSRVGDGQTLITSGSKQELDAPPTFLAKAFPGDPMTEVFARHRQRLDETTHAATGVYDVNDLERVLRAYEEANFDFQVERGVYVPISGVTVERLRRLALTTKPPVRKPVWVQYQGLEFLSWLMLAVSIFLFANGPPANQAQFIFRFALAVAALLGISVIWVLRLVNFVRQ